MKESASQDEIKKAYRKLAKTAPPRRQSRETPRRSERFKEIGEAYSVLSDEKKRKHYDQMKRVGGLRIRWRRAVGGPSPGEDRTRVRRTRPREGFSFEDLSGFGGGLSDLFSTIFDRGKKEPNRGGTGPAKGRNVEYVVEVAFETSVMGGRISINVPITEECATCGGSGAAPGTHLQDLLRVQGVRNGLLRSGRLCGKAPLPGLYGPGNDPGDPVQTL